MELKFQLTKLGWGGNTWDKVLSVILVLTVLGALGILGYMIATPRVEERFTEFYILSLEGKSAHYPRELAVGEMGSVIVGIVNREYETASYWVEVRIDGDRNNEVEGILLEHGEEWRGEVNFTPHRTGNNQKVEFLLYKGGEVEPCFKPLRLLLNVRE